jgi:hypothetical protein
MPHSRLWKASAATLSIHLVVADHAVRLDRATELGLLELLARDVRENNAIAPRKADLALEAALGVNELCVAAQSVDDLMRIVARLLKRVGDGLGHAVRCDVPCLLARLADRVEPPVFDFEDQ